MATPQQLLMQAKGRIRQPNMQGSRGTPGRGGQAARPVPKRMGEPGGQSAGSTGGVKLPPLQSLRAGGQDSTQADTFPGFQPRPGGGLQTLSGREPNMTPDKPIVEPGGPPADLQAKLAGLPPQIQAAIKNRGLATVMANRAGLAGRLGMPEAPAAPDQAVSDAAALDLPASPTGPRPLPPGAEPGGAPGLQVQAFPGFKPRPGGAGVTAGAPTGLTARPMPGTIPADGPQPTAPGLGQTISDPADQMGGFEGLGRVGAGLRRPRPQAMAY